MKSTIPVLALVLLAISAAHASDTNRFELVGRVLQSDGKPFGGVTPVLFLHGAITPYTAQTQAWKDGKFKFKNLPAGTYTLIVSVPRAGEVRKTVEVGPSFADPKRRVLTSVTLERAGAFENDSRITAAELAIHKSARLEYEKAQACLSRSDAEGAAAHLKEAVEIAPQYSVAWNLMGTIAYQTRKYVQAEEYFREALKQDPESYSPLVNLGGALLAQGKVKESLPINQAAVRIRPDDPLAHSQTGMSYFFLDQIEDAENHLKRAKSLDPSHFSYPQLLLVEIYARKNQLPDAMAEMEEFLRLHPDSDYVPKLRAALEKALARASPKP